MPLFMPDEELARLFRDAASAVAERADEYIRKIYAELDSVRAKADAASITAEQKYLSLSQDFSSLESQNAKLQSDFDDRLAELAQSQAQKHQLHLQSIEKDGEVERMTTEMSELHKSKRQLMELLEQKDAEISEKNSTIKSYLDKIVKLTDTCSEKESRLAEASARSQAMCSRLSQVMKPSLNDSHSGTSELENRVVEESPQPETMEQREARRDREMQQMREVLQSLQTMLGNLTMGEARSAPLQGSFTIIERLEEFTKNTIDGFLHILNTGSEEELIHLKGFAEKRREKVLQCRPITKVEDLGPKFTFKQFNVLLMRTLKDELDKKQSGN